jgi:hypothetical protein
VSRGPPLPRDDLRVSLQSLSPMQIRLGIVCPRASRDVFQRAAEGVSGVVPRWVVYQAEKGIRSHVESALADVDALCFSGSLPLDRCRDILPGELPTAVVQFTGVDLAVCLFRARDRGLPPAPVSIDSIDQGLVDELVDELGIDRAQVACLPHGPDVTVEEVVAFHEQAHTGLHTAFAISGRSNAFGPLRSTLPIPIIQAAPGVPSIRAAMNRATLAAIARRHSDLRFAAAVFRAGDDVSASKRRRIDRSSALADALHASTELADAWVEARSEGEGVLVFGHNGLMQRLTRDWTAVPIAVELHEALGFDVAVGFGIGNSARHSVEYAEAAVKRASREGGSCGYLLTEDGVVIGPIGSDGELAAPQHFRTDNGAVAGLARKVGLSIGTLSRLLEYERKVGPDAAVSAADIGHELRLTAPSGRRIVRILKSHGVVREVGTAHLSGRGRPMSLYRLELQRHLGERAGARQAR